MTHLNSTGEKLLPWDPPRARALYPFLGLLVFILRNVFNTPAFGSGGLPEPYEQLQLIGGGAREPVICRQIRQVVGNLEACYLRVAPEWAGPSRGAEPFAAGTSHCVRIGELTLLTP